MGQAKHEAMKDEEKHDLALGIAKRARVVDFCSAHGVCYYAGAEIDPAYKFGNVMFARGELGDMYEDRREMTDYIKQAVESCLTECYECSRFRESD